MAQIYTDAFDAIKLLRIKGYSFTEIHIAFVSPNKDGIPAYNADDIKATIQAYKEQEDFREIELERLDYATRELIELVRDGKSGYKAFAARSLVDISNRRAQLLGLDKPTKVESEQRVLHQIENFDPKELE